MPYEFVRTLVLRFVFELALVNTTCPNFSSSIGCETLYYNLS